MPSYLKSKAFPKDPKIFSLLNGETNLFSAVEHVTGEEKYEC